MFAIVALPYEALRDLPPLEFKAMAALLRYTNRAGECWPALRQLAADIGKSEATACRVMQRLAEKYECFVERRRAGNGRYFYKIAERFLPRWPSKRTPPEPAANPQPAEVSSCTTTQDGLAHDARQEANPTKQAREGRVRPQFGRSETPPGGLPDMTDQWRTRIGSWMRSGGKFWLPQWGPKPDEPGCFAPAAALSR